MKRLFVPFIFFIAFGLVYLGCDTDVFGPSNGTGTLLIYLTDAPGDFSKVNIQIERVEVHSADEDAWKVVNTFDVDEEEGKFDLLELTNGVMVAIGDEVLSAGNYTQIRLILTDNNYVVLKDGDEHHLKVPSGQQTGLKLHYDFTIEADETYEILLDFDARRSIHEAGESGLWILNPVIRVQSIAESGDLTGRVVDTGENPVENATVSVLDESEDTVATAGTNEEGGFTMVHLAPGDYFVEVEKEGYQTKRLDDKVTVVVGQVTDLGDITLEAE